MKGKLYTSYFANIMNIPHSMRVFSVVRQPQDIPNIIDLSPSAGLLNQYKSKRITYEDFSKRFINELANNPKASVMFDSLSNLLNQGIDVVLVCYEKNSTFCHRKILGEIFSTSGIEYCGEV